ncbi:MAG: c-type cytochrome [Gemmataceae bacterium]|nr:c-type cytochrome [Gemmataceae bacterium]
MRASAVILLFAAFAGFLAKGIAQPKAAIDLGKELPRIAPKEPKDAVKTFTIAPGFRIELVACEPLIRSPVAIDFDEDGRLYVAEFPEYNLHDDPTFKEKGCIKRLEDADGDGVFDKATTYVDNLPAPTAVGCWDGGVFVGSVPNLLYCKDTDGDGKADIRETVLTGFERDKAGEAMLNSFRWGLDNRIHISTSLAGGSVRPSNHPKEEPTSVRSRFLILDPRTRKFETTTGAGQHGMSMDDWGEKFVCDNSNPIHHILYDGRYAARNPYLAAPPVAANIHDQASEPKLARTSDFEPWRVVRTRLRMAGQVKGPTEGGRVGGHFTGATGVTIYRGDAFPEECRGQAFVGEVSNNLVHRMNLKPKGTSFVASRADAGREFLASSDNWFRPCQFANGPDGCLYVVDMYRELIETIVSIPPEILKHLHPESGVDRGRIWRIVPEGHKRRPLPQLSKATTAELVALLDHPNGWHRDTASRLLYQRQDRIAIPLLAKLAKEASTPQGRMHALRSLEGLAGLKAEALMTALGDPHPRVVEHAIQLCEKLTDHPALFYALAKRVIQAPAIESRIIRQGIWTLGQSDTPDSLENLGMIAAKPWDDPAIRFAILTSAKTRPGSLAQSLLRRRTFRITDSGNKLLLDLAAMVGLAGQDDQTSLFLEAVEELPKDQPQHRDLLAMLIAKSPPAARTKLQSASVQAVLKKMTADAKRVVLDAKRSPADRAAAARNLRLESFASAKPLFVQLLDPRHPEEVQKAALDAIGSSNDADAAIVILDAWSGLSPKVRAAAAETLLSRPAWIGAWLDALEKGRIKTSEVDPARVTLLRQTGDDAAKTRIEKLFAGNALSKRVDVIAAYKPALDRKGDIAKGREAFRKHCVACHRLEGVGEQIGAELTGIQDRGAEFLLLNILDPNREVLPKFVAYQAVTDAGRTISGMIQSETATSVTLRRPDGTSETILRANLESLRSTGLSFMPEGFEKQISPNDMSDLIAYLLSAR